MSNERLFIDTVFIQALLNKGDQYHLQAIAFAPRVRQAREVVVTEAILVEVGNALSSEDRSLATRFIEKCYQTANMRVVSIDTALLRRGLQLYQQRQDKTWGLTDCISFVTMSDYQLMDAVTADIHFVQAGFRALLRD
jgi:predicted nucleic acid-binding protein